MLLSDGLFEVKEVNSEAYTYWKDGYFYFDELPLADIMKSIGRWYNVNVTFRNKKPWHIAYILCPIAKAVSKKLFV